MTGSNNPQKTLWLKDVQLPLEGFTVDVESPKKGWKASLTGRPKGVVAIELKKGTVTRK